MMKGGNIKKKFDIYENKSEDDDYIQKKQDLNSSNSDE